jgi:hypothetical protein
MADAAPTLRSLYWCFLMTHGFDDYRVFISAPGDVEPDRQACYDAIASVNENTAMPAKLLLVTVGLRESEQISSHRAIVSDNVRWSSYFVQIFQDDWGPRDLFRKLFLLAVDCRNDSTMPMRDVLVCLKDAPGETHPEILAFRKELEEGSDCRVLRYQDPDELRVQVEEVCAVWAGELMDRPDRPATTEASPGAPR